MSRHFDALETRTPEVRHAAQRDALNAQLARHGIDPLSDLSGLARLPVLRKSDLVARQKAQRPFGGLPVSNLAHVFQSPGPIYEPGGVR